MNKLGLIFDCDGTLIDSLDVTLESFNFAIAGIGEPPRTTEQIKRYFGAGADRIFSQLLGDEKKGMAAFEVYLRHQAELALSMKLHKGIRELLETAAAAGIPMGVVTGRHQRDMELVLRPQNISNFFTTMVADSHVSKPKPAPDGIILAAKQMGLQPENICYVGDSTVDIQAAHAAGGLAIAALWDGLAKEEAMAAENPELLAFDPAEVWTYFSELLL